MSGWRDFPGWLRSLPDVPETTSSPMETAQALLKDMPVRLELEEDLGESFRICASEDGHVITGGAVGVLYGAYRYLFHARAGLALPAGLRLTRTPMQVHSQVPGRI